MIRRLLRRRFDVERDVDRTRPAYGFLAGRHGVTVTAGLRVWRIRRLRYSLPMPPPGPRRVVTYLGPVHVEPEGLRVVPVPVTRHGRPW